MSLRRIAREPLLHFLLVGVALFVLFDSEAYETGVDRRIVVDAPVVAGLVQHFHTTWSRAPTDAEIAGLIDWHVREEVLFREGVELGLDRDDPVIKRRVRQKMDVMLEESLDAAPPTDAELAAYLAAHAETFSLPPTVSFTQIFLGNSATAGTAEGLASQVRGKLAEGGDPATLGRPTLLPSTGEGAPLDIVSRDFGPQFAERLQHLPLAEWAGPVSSSYGEHLVRVDARTPAALPPLDSIRARVTRAWELDRRSRTADESYRRLRERYDVVVQADRASVRVAGNGSDATQAGAR